MSHNPNMAKLAQLPGFIQGHRLGLLAVEDPDDPAYSADQELVPAGPDAISHAEILTSWTGETEAPPAVATNANDWSALAHQPETYHRPVLDLDFDAALVPSSSADHHHLYLDKVLTWSDYVKLLNVLAEVGIIEPGYRDASIAREFTSVRLPWVSKAAPADPAPDVEGCDGSAKCPARVHVEGCFSTNPDFKPEEV